LDVIRIVVLYPALVATLAAVGVHAQVCKLEQSVNVPGYPAVLVVALSLSSAQRAVPVLHHGPPAQ
jgi:hypothetical protein